MTWSPTSTAWPAVMERQRPIWPPGERQAYHAITLGFYENELVRRIDPRHRTIGQVLHEDIATPLGVGDEVYIGTPSSVPDERLAALVPPGLWARLTSMPLSFTIDAMRPRSVLHRSLVANPGTSFYVDPDHVIVRELEVPSGGAVATARAIATATEPSPPRADRSVCARKRSKPSRHRRRRPARGTTTSCSGDPTKFSLGFMKPSELIDFGSEAAFGAPGAGGSMGFADPAARPGLRLRDRQDGHGPARRPPRPLPCVARSPWSSRTSDKPLTARCRVDGTDRRLRGKRPVGCSSRRRSRRRDLPERRQVDALRVR